jgi:hypothetical protein
MSVIILLTKVPSFEDRTIWIDEQLFVYLNSTPTTKETLAELLVSLIEKKTL